MPKWTGKALAAFPSIPSCLSPTISPRASPVATGPLTMGGGPTWCQNTSPSPSHPSGVLVLEVRPLLLLPLPPLPLPQDPCIWRGPWWAEDQAWDLSRGSWGPKWAGETWPCSLLILCPPSCSPVFPFRRGIPSPPPAAPQGRQFRPASTSPPPSLPSRPTSYLVAGGSSCLLRCPWSPTGAW